MYKRVDLSTIIPGNQVHEREEKNMTVQCQNCGANFRIRKDLVWRKYHNMACYKEAVAERKRINKILNA